MLVWRRSLILLLTCGVFATTGMAKNPETIRAGFAGETDRVLTLIDTAGGPLTDAASSALCGAAGGGRSDTIERLLAAGVPIDCTDGHGGTPLQYAAMQGQAETVRLLLQRGAKANLLSHCTDPKCEGHFAIVSGVRSGKIEIVRMLLQAGADPTVLDNLATNEANRRGNIEMFQLLSSFGGKATAAATPGPTPPPIVKPSPPARSAMAKLGLTEVLPPNRTSNPHPKRNEKLRLAIIADAPNASAADLLTSRLSKQASLELVERQELIRILTERNLTQQFAADVANYSKVGALLNADALLLVHNRDINGTPAIESRLIRVNPGLVLNTSYQAAPLSSLPEWTAQMERLIDRFSDRVVGTNTIALSVLNLRSSLGNPSVHALERTLNLVLRARLAAEPGFVLLERDAMQRLMLENPANSFCAGAYFVDGSIEPALDQSGAFKMTVRFKPATGSGQTIAISASGLQSDPGPAMTTIFRDLRTRIGGAGARAAGDSANEAQEYQKEAEWALRAGLGQWAKNAADSAWALGLHNLAVARIRVLGPLHVLEEEHAKLRERIAAVSNHSVSDVHDWLNHPARGPDCLTPEEWLDLAIEGGTIWAETLESGLTAKPEDLKLWLDIAPDVQADLALGLTVIDTAAEQSRQAERLKILRQIFWEGFETARRRVAELPVESTYLNSIAELEAKSVRLVVRHPSDQVTAIRDLLKLHFAKQDALTRAHIRLTLNNWNMAQAIGRATRNISWGYGLELPVDDEVKRSVIGELRTSAEPDDRFLSGLLELARHGAAPPGQAEVVERIRNSVWDMRDLLAGDKEVAYLYTFAFNSLTGSGIPGAPFFEDHLVDSEPKRLEPSPEFEAFSAKLQSYINAHAGKIIRRTSASGIPLHGPIAQVALASANPGVTPSPTIVPSVRPNPSPLAITRIDDARALRVEKFWTPFGPAKLLPENFELQSYNACWADGRIWLYAVGRTINPSRVQRCFFNVDPLTMESQVSAFPPEPPPEPGNDGTGFIVTSTHLVVAAHGAYLAVFDRVTKRWEFYRDIKPMSGDAPVISHDSAFLFVRENSGSALIRFDLKSRTAEVLASTRRYPAVSPLDNPRFNFVYLGTDETGDIIVESQDDEAHQCETVAWSPATHEWRVVHPLAPGRKNPQSMNWGTGWTQTGRVYAQSKRPDGSVPLTMRLGLANGGAFEVPLAFILPPGLDLPKYAGMSQPLGMFNGWWRSCPAGVVFVPRSGGFWFLPNDKVVAYINALQAPPLALTGAASNSR